MRDAWRVLACVLMLSPPVCAQTGVGNQAPRAGDEAAPAGRYREIAERIVQETLAGNDAYRKLTELCYDIGHRLSGSPQLERALEWAARTLREDGQEGVRIERVMVPHWVRGEESLTLVQPRVQPLAMLGLGGSVGTPPEGITAPVISVADEHGLEELGEHAQGAIILFDNPMPPYSPENGAEYGTAVRFRGNGARLASRHGAVACLIRSVTATSLRTPHTGAMRYGDAPVRIPAAAVSIEDATMITRLQERGQQVVVTLRMGAQDKGRVPSGNVIAELRGSALPHEIVIVSGHIDSWDVGQGAHDDGAGSVMAMETLNVLRRLGLRARRTIRLVLWTNEENGLAGAKQYVQDHAAELSKHVAAIEADSGGFRPVGYSVECRDEARQARAVEQMRDILRLVESLGATSARAGHSGADLIPMGDTDIVRLGHNCDGSRYFDYHHSQADTLDKVEPEALSHNVAVMAVVAYVLADMPEAIGESPND